MKNYWPKALVKPQYLGLLTAVILLVVGMVYQAMNPPMQAPEQFTDIGHLKVGIRFSDHDSSSAFLPNNIADTTVPDYSSAIVKEIPTTTTAGDIEKLFRLEGQAVLEKQDWRSSDYYSAVLVIDLPPQELLEPTKFIYNNYEFNVDDNCLVKLSNNGEKAPTDFTVTGEKKPNQRTAVLGFCQIRVEYAFKQRSCGTAPIDVYLVIDCSGSMNDKPGVPNVFREWPSKLDYAKEAAKQFVDALEANGGVGEKVENGVVKQGIHRVGIISFNTKSDDTANVVTEVSLRDNAEAEYIKQKIDGLYAQNGTPTKSAMSEAKKQMNDYGRKDKDVGHVFVFLSDGRPDPTSYSPTQLEIDGYKAAVDKAYSVALGDDFYKYAYTDKDNYYWYVDPNTNNIINALDLMKKLAKPEYRSDSNPGGFRWVKRAWDLPGVYGQIFTEMACPQTVSNFRFTFEEPVKQTRVSNVINALKSRGDHSFGQAFLGGDSCSSVQDGGYLCLKPRVRLYVDVDPTKKGDPDQDPDKIYKKLETSLSEYIRYANIEISGNVAATELKNFSVGAGSIAVGDRITNVNGQTLPTGSFSASRLNWSKVGPEIANQYYRGKHEGRWINGGYYQDRSNLFNLNASEDNPASGIVTSFSSPPEGKLWFANGNLSFSNTVHFTGSGTIVVNGSVNFFDDLTCDSGTRLGIVALGDINFGSKADNIGCGAYVALKRPNNTGGGDIIISDPVSLGGTLNGILIAQDEVVLPNGGKLRSPYTINYDQYFATHPTILFRQILEQVATAF